MMTGQRPGASCVHCCKRWSLIWCIHVATLGFARRSFDGLAEGFVFAEYARQAPADFALKLGLAEWGSTGLI